MRKNVCLFILTAIIFGCVKFHNGRPSTINVQIGGAQGWTYGTCSTASTCCNSTLTAVNSSFSVSLILGGCPPMGNSTFTVTSGTPGIGQTQIIMLNTATNETWICSSGMIGVNTVTTIGGCPTTVTFSNIPCFNYTADTKSITLSGALTCI